jgi:hypothetical protein
MVGQWGGAPTELERPIFNHAAHDRVGVECGAAISVLAHPAARVCARAGATLSCTRTHIQIPGTLPAEGRTTGNTRFAQAKLPRGRHTEGSRSARGNGCPGLIALL